MTASSSDRVIAAAQRIFWDEAARIAAERSVTVAGKVADAGREAKRRWTEAREWVRAHPTEVEMILIYSVLIGLEVWKVYAKSRRN